MKTLLQSVPCGDARESALLATVSHVTVSTHPAHVPDVIPKRSAIAFRQREVDEKLDPSPQRIENLNGAVGSCLRLFQRRRIRHLPKAPNPADLATMAPAQISRRPT
ncbi:MULTISPECIES: hypothetical protein [unclassified Variovorax]|uniref:hypothetical protein n=1 Tax=unclassified Variovorax TaxID=663243 RepID=UPI002B23EB02|nr:hypothetical protein [Variovorax sp. LG9.2]MEB0060182.1 hypothetical protein [Variovorax sp. LG9.2]